MLDEYTCFFRTGRYCGEPIIREVGASLEIDLVMVLAEWFCLAFW
jgi:hypothetical protein